MAVRDRDPEPGFLEGARDLAHEHGALFILDEIRTGFRLALGGAQQHFGVVPDLATFGKALANGFTLSVVAGRAEHMRHVRESWFSSTFNTSSMEQAAALATIAELRRTDGIGHIWRIGRRLMEGLDGLAQAHGVEAQAVSLPPTPYLQFTYRDPALREAARQVFFTETVRRGVFFHPHHHWFRERRARGGRAGRDAGGQRARIPGGPPGDRHRTGAAGGSSRSPGRRRAVSGHALASRILGYPPDARLLIVNADDFGMCHTQNVGTVRAMREGLVRSCSLMAPPPWGLHGARLLRENPDVPFGVHLTLVSEFRTYRWGPLLPRGEVSSLVDDSGSFHPDDRIPEAVRNLLLHEAEREFRAQIEWGAGPRGSRPPTWTATTTCTKSATTCST